MPKINSLVRHGSKDMARKRGVVGFCSELHRYGEVPLGDRMLGIVERHPADEVGQFTGSGEHPAPYVLISVGGTQVACDVRGQVLNDGRTGMSSASALIDAREELDRLPDRFKVSCAYQPTTLVNATLGGALRQPVPPGLIWQCQSGGGVTGRPQYRPALDIQGTSPEIDQRRQRIGMPVEYR
ncbi:hypothetical protein [Kribbella sancticallisti]|uniref:hypothetical protein n=1 Tax=Kribbella sancticallisti TaxID=460087 RepID=UPI0031DDD8E6